MTSEYMSPNEVLVSQPSSLAGVILYYHSRKRFDLESKIQIPKLSQSQEGLHTDSACLLILKLAPNVMPGAAQPFLGPPRTP